MSPAPKGPHPFADLMGLKVTRTDDGYSLVTLEVQEKHLNPQGSVHGGVAYALADTGMAAALYSSLSEDESPATLEVKITYLQAVTTGTLECETRVLRKGRRFAMLESEVLQGGTLVAKASGTYAISTRPTQG